MYAALKQVFAFVQVLQRELATLENASSGHFYARKAARTFRDCCLSAVQPWDESAAKLRYLGEGMRFAALVNGLHRRSVMHGQRIGFKVPVRVGRAGRRFRK